MYHKTILCSKHGRQYFSKEFQSVNPEKSQLRATNDNQHRYKEYLSLCLLPLAFRANKGIYNTPKHYM